MAPRLRPEKPTPCATHASGTEPVLWAGALGWVSGRAPPSLFTLWRRSLGTIYGVCLLLSCADRVLNPRHCVQIMVAGAPGRTGATIGPTNSGTTVTTFSGLSRVIATRTLSSTSSASKVYAQCGRSAACRGPAKTVGSFASPRLSLAPRIGTPAAAPTPTTVSGSSTHRITMRTPMSTTADCPSWRRPGLQHLRPRPWPRRRAAPPRRR